MLMFLRKFSEMFFNLNCSCRTIAVLSLFLSLCACSEKSPKGPETLSTVVVSGVVTLKGKPLADASISMHHSEGKVAPRGVSDASGAFVISTYGDKDGAPVGQYKVTVSQSVAKEISPGVLAPIPTEGIKTAVPLKYERVDTTDITVEVKADQTNSLEIELR